MSEVVDFEEQKKKLKDRIDSTEDDFKLDDHVKLKEMNDKHAFINSVGGKPMVLCYTYSVVAKRKIVEFRSPDAIKTQYANQSVKVDKQYIKQGMWWLEHASRREYDTIIFDPSKEREWEGCFNLWEGLALKPIKGDWECVLRHLYRVLCNKDRDKFLYTIKWLAWCLQNPGKRAEVAVIFKGKEGAGKGFIFTQLLKIFGQHGISIANRKHLTGQFNGHLRHCVFLFADEAYYPGDKEVEGCLKQLITEEYIPIEGKHMQMGPSNNCLHIGMSTNQEWVIPANEDSRRYFINEVENTYAKNQCTDSIRNSYFERLWDCMDNGGREAMVYDLLKMDLTGWHPRSNVPVTAEMTKQRRLSLPRLETDILNMLDEGIFEGDKNDEYGYIISSKQLWKLLDDLNPDKRKLSSVKKAERMTLLGCIVKHRMTGNHWVFPELHVMRRNWEALYGQFNWSNEVLQWNVTKPRF